MIEKLKTKMKEEIMKENKNWKDNEDISFKEETKEIDRINKEIELEKAFRKKTKEIDGVEIANFEANNETKPYKVHLPIGNFAYVEFESYVIEDIKKQIEIFKNIHVDSSKINSNAQKVNQWVNTQEKENYASEPKRRASDKQIKFANTIAKRLKQDVQWDEDSSIREINEYIDTYKDVKYNRN